MSTAVRSPLRLSSLSWGVALPVAFLLGVGLLTIHATDRTRAAETEAVKLGLDAQVETSLIQKTLDYVGPTTIRQTVFIGTGIALLLMTLAPSYMVIGRYTWILYWIAIFLLACLVLDRYIDLPFVPVRRATRRWIDIGPIAIQPSEFMKPVLILALAYYLRYRDSYRRLGGLIPPFALTMLPMVLILKQPDLGTLLMLLPVLFAMLFVAGARLRHIITIIIAGVVTLPIFYTFGMKPYQKQRIDVVFKQNTKDEKWQMGPGYQLRQSKIALGTGGVFGEGFAQGMFIEHALLPEEHNDLIFAIIGHQWGLVGCAMVILAYGAIVLFGIEVAAATNDPFGRLLAIGVIVMIVVQALLNMSMSVGLAPITGMTLPFVSAGGSSLWANFIALGLLLNVAQRRPLLLAKPPFSHED